MLVRLNKPADIFAPHDFVTVRQAELATTYSASIYHDVNTRILRRTYSFSQVLGHLKAAVEQFAVTHRTPAA
jgi:hypothetical protein